MRGYHYQTEPQWAICASLQRMRGVGPSDPGMLRGGRRSWPDAARTDESGIVGQLLGVGAPRSVSTKGGRSVHRARIVPEPLSDYQRWSFTIAYPVAGAGESAHLRPERGRWRARPGPRPPPLPCR